jgi:hypothetical protein
MGENKKAVDVACAPAYDDFIEPSVHRRTATRQQPTPTIDVGANCVIHRHCNAHATPPHQNGRIIAQSRELSSRVGTGGARQNVNAILTKIKYRTNGPLV